MESQTKTIASAKREIRLQEWAAQIEAQQASGLTVRRWCLENGVACKSYYYHLRKVREHFLSSLPAIVPMEIPQPVPSADSEIRIEKDALQISLPANIPPETLLALVQALC